MPTTANVVATGNTDIDGILSGVRWASGNLTFSFPSLVTAYPAGYSVENEPGTFSPLNTTQQNAVRVILSMFGDVANLNFTETTQGAGTLRFAMSDAPGTAWGYYPSNDAKAVGGDVWFNKDDYNSPEYGNYAWMTIIHEIGHALGLKHGHEADGGFPALPASHNSVEYSVMTYAAYVGDPLTTGYAIEQTSYPTTLMMDDIAALQYMYGADFTTNSGNTVYTWSPTTGRESINGVAQTMPAGNHILMTTWDGGGIDTYDLSNYSTNLSIDLRPGAWSTFSTAQLSHLDQYTTNTHIAAGNVANALLYNNDVRSLIENAIGGTGNDTITGNQADNTLSGGAGNDTLHGGVGNDTLIGGSGNNILDGESGFDVADYSTSPILISVNIANGTVSNGFGGTDTLSAIEDVTQRLNHTDGAYSSYHWDILNLNAWTDYNATYDAGGHALSAVQNNDDGTHTNMGWDAGNQFSWANFTSTYDSAMRAVSAWTDYDNGTHTQLEWDAQNQADWANFTVNYDSALRRTDAFVNNDDGSHVQLAYDPQNLFTWSDFTIDYDNANRRIDGFVNNDDGSHIQLGYDPQNLATWTDFTINYDSSNRRTTAILNNDDNTHVLSTYDPNNTANWDHYDSTFDPNWNLIRTVYTYDDGTTLIV